jgi:glutathione S-transferase
MGDTVVDLFFSQNGSSLAARITSYEAGVTVKFIEVDPMTQRTSDGRDYREISPLGLLPALRLDDGFLLTEGAALLQHVAAYSNTSNLVPLNSLDLHSLYQWLYMAGTAMNEAISTGLFDQKIVAGTATHTRKFVISSLDFLNVLLTQRQYLLYHFSVADAYLCSLLISTTRARIDFSPWPAINAYYDRLLKRPSVARAMTEERVLHETQAARHRLSSELSWPALA